MDADEGIAVLIVLGFFGLLAWSLGTWAHRWSARLETLFLRLTAPGSRRVHVDAVLREAWSELWRLWPALPAAALVGALVGTVGGVGASLHAAILLVIAASAATTAAAGVLLRPPRVAAGILVSLWAIGLVSLLLTLTFVGVRPGNAAVFAGLMGFVALPAIVLARRRLIESEWPPG